MNKCRSRLFSSILQGRLLVVAAHRNDATLAGQSQAARRVWPLVDNVADADDDRVGANTVQQIL
jgi:hypothetical protein